MKIALVHDFLVRFGGAEKLLQAWAEKFPDAPIYTLFWDPKKMKDHFEPGIFRNLEERIRPSYLQKWYKFSGGRYTWLLPWMPKAMESFDFSGFDAVLSSSAAFSHGIITGTDQKHVCYVHSPMRWAWDWHFNFMEERGMNSFSRAVFRKICKKLRIWDVAAAGRPDVLLAASSVIQKRISKYWRKESEIVHPFVDLGKFKIFEESEESEDSEFFDDSKVSKNSEEYYLIVSQLVPYKKIELAIKACGELGLNLKIVGEGIARNYLEKITPKNSKIEFLGAKYGKELAKIFQKAKAFIFPSVDDFGMAPVEAMACGIPVIAYKAGGALDWLIDGKNGLFFEEQTVDSLKEKLNSKNKTLQFKNSKFFKEKIRAEALKFSKEKHIESILKKLN